jgi:hypothetical protein
VFEVWGDGGRRAVSGAVTQDLLREAVPFALTAAVAAGMARAFVLPLLVTLAASLVPARRSDRLRDSGALRDALPPELEPPTVRRTFALAGVWLRAFIATQRTLHALRTVFELPSLLAKLVCFRFLPRHVVLHDSIGEGGRKGSALLTLALADDGSWWLEDLAAWPLGRKLSERLVRRVLSAADAAGRTIRLRSANRALADGYYARLGFRLDARPGDAARPSMTRDPIKADQNVRRPKGIGVREPNR